MADRTDVKLTTESNEGKTINTSITYVNPEATNAQLKLMAQQFNALTTNTYETTYRIDTTNCDSNIDNRQTPTLTADSVSTAASSINTTGANLSYSYSGDGYVYIYPTSGLVNIRLGLIDSSHYNIARCDANGGTPTPTAGTFVIAATGTDNYKPVKLEITVS